MSLLRWGLASSGWVALAAVAFLPEAAVLRVILTTAFLLVCPGLTALRWGAPTSARATDPAILLETAVLALVVSMSLSVLVAEALFLSGVFTVTRALLTLAVLTSLLAMLPRPGGTRGPVRRAAPDDGSPTAVADRTEPPAGGGGAGPIMGVATAAGLTARRFAAAVVAGVRR
ncbi:hypothetical protein [Streptomyces longisporus]|uniref:Integral membrane protein n=1 Tax=Streptomyces longisporus TaxID=1948 RepID=A0ABP5YYQ3_STRLO